LSEQFIVAARRIGILVLPAASALVSAGAFAQAAIAPHTPLVTPYRPTVSNPAELPEPGYIEIEAGGIRTATAGSSRRSLPYMAKLAVNPDWGLLLSGDLRVWDNTTGVPIKGLGDTSITLKHHIGTGSDAINLGLEAGVKFPTAAAGLGNDKRDWTVTGILSYDIAEDWRLDTNLGITTLGAREPGLGSDYVSWAAALSRSLGPWTLAGEFSQTSQRGAPNASQWLFAVGYTVMPRLILDAGFARGRDGGDRPRSIFVGLSWLTNWMF
jgi:hypothetical protein